MDEIAKWAAYLPVSEEALREAAVSAVAFADGLNAALRGERRAELPPEPATLPAAHLTLLRATSGLLRAVVELHAPVWSHPGWRCHGCDLGPYPEDLPDWPCSTAELIAGNAGVELEEVADGG